MMKLYTFYFLIFCLAPTLVFGQGLRINLPSPVDATAGVRGLDFNTPIWKIDNFANKPLLNLDHQGNFMVGDGISYGQFTIANSPISTSNGLYLNNPNGFGSEIMQFRNTGLASKFWQLEAFTFLNNPSAYMNISHTDAGNVLFLTGNRNVGIGTLSPNAALTVAGNARWTGQLRLNGHSGNTGDILTINTTTGLPEWKQPSAVNAQSVVPLQVPINGFVENTVTNSEYIVATIPMAIDTSKGVLEYDFSFAVTSSGFARGNAVVSLLRAGQVFTNSNNNQFHFNVDGNRIKTAAFSSHFDLRNFNTGNYTLQLKILYEEGPPIYFGPTYIPTTSATDYFFQYKFLK